MRSEQKSSQLARCRPCGSQRSTWWPLADAPEMTAWWLHVLYKEILRAYTAVRAARHELPFSRFLCWS